MSKDVLEVMFKGFSKIFHNIFGSWSELRKEYNNPKAAFSVSQVIPQDVKH